MISYHLNMSMDAKHYAAGFKPAFVSDMHRIAKCITKYVWSPCLWEDGRRTQKNFKGAKFCVLDFDDGEMSLEEAKKIFCDCIHLIGTTKSHQKEKNNQICDRFRVLFVFDEPIYDLRLYRYNMHKFMRNYPCDQACKDGARFFYPCQQIVSISADGYTQDIDTNIPEDFERARPIPEFLLSSRIIPNRIYMKLERNFKKFSRNKAIYGFAKDVAPFGFTPTEILMRVKESNAFKKCSEDLSDEEMLTAINNGIKAYKEVL